jgi:hypothetical protein
MKLKGLLIIVIAFFAGQVNAQDMTVDQIFENYYENTGGKEAWSNLEGIKMVAKTNQGGMEIPLEIVQLEDGRTYTQISLQGQNLYQNVYDGSVLWGVNFQTMKPEKADQETTDNMKLELNDFPDAFLNYKEKGYTAELVGMETIEGTETYKVKLVKEPKMLDGKEVESVTYYYFETENFVPIVQETEIKQGQMAGKIQQVMMSDYQEVSDGIMMPYSMKQGVKDMGSQTITIESIVLNPEVDESIFEYKGE